MEKRLNIMVVEPSGIVYEGLTNLLLKSTHRYHIFRVNSLDEIAELPGNTSFDLAIINPHQVNSSMNNFEAIKNRYPNAVWIALLYSPAGAEIPGLFDDSFTLEDDFNTVLEKINDHGQGQRQEATAEEDVSLSNRETEVLALVTRGFSNRAIAEKLFISIHTVITHRKNITEKTGIKSLPGLTLFAVSRGILSMNETLE